MKLGKCKVEYTMMMPIERAASTNSKFFTLITWPRTVRDMVSHDTRAMAKNSTRILSGIPTTVALLASENIAIIMLRSLLTMNLDIVASLEWNLDSWKK